MPAVLVVEDESAIADTIVYALASEGFSVRHAALALEAREFLRSQSFDLVVLDIGLPDTNGLDFFREIRAARDTPILFLTARSGEIDRVLGLVLGADDYVTKPFSPRDTESPRDRRRSHLEHPIHGQHSRHNARVAREDWNRSAQRQVPAHPGTQHTPSPVQAPENAAPAWD